MKYLYFSFILLFLSTGIGQLSAQSRNSGVFNISVQTKSEKLRKAKGWKQNTSGVWVSNDNAISDIQLEVETRNTVTQNFTWLQLVAITTPKQPYYVFLFENENYISGDVADHRVNYFIMDGVSYATFVNTIKGKAAETVVINSSMFGFMSNKSEYNSAKLIQLIEQTISAPLQEQYELSINSQRVDNEDVVRFRIPELSSSLRPANLANSYFEIPWVEFNAILLPFVGVNKNNEFDLDNLPATLPKPQQPQQNVTEINTPLDDFDNRDFAAPINTPSTDVQNTPNKRPRAKSESTDLNDDFGERVNEAKPVLSLQSFATLNNISGHYLDNASREWVGENSPLYKFETVGSYLMRDYFYKDKEYIIFTRKEKFAGEFHVLVGKDEYVKAIQQFKVSSKIRIPIITYSGLINTLDDMVELGEKAINTTAKEHTVIFKETYLVLQYKLSQTKGLARFYTYIENCSRYGTSTTSSNCQKETSNKIRYDDVAFLGSDKLFKKMYFETNYDSFINFFIKAPLEKKTDNKPVSNVDIDF